MSTVNLYTDIEAFKHFFICTKFLKPVCTITLMTDFNLDKPHVKGSIATGGQRFLHLAIIVLHFVSDSIPPETSPSYQCYSALWGRVSPGKMIGQYGPC